MKILKELRNENNLSQTQLAETIGTSQRNIVRWENDETEPTTFFIVKLAKVFGVSADYLLGLEDDTGSKTYEPQNYGITPDERKVLKAYRELSPSNKELVLAMLKIK